MQQITPIEIRQKSFGKSFRGYKTDEVDAFLHSLAYAWEKLTVQLSEVRGALEGSSKEVKRLQGVENALLRTIKDSENTAHHIIEQAKQEAQLKAREIEFEIEKMLREAQEKAKAVEEDSVRRRQAAQQRMAREVEATKKVVQETETYRDSLLQKLQYLAEDILTMRQIIEKNIQPPLFIDKPLKGSIEEQEPDKNAFFSSKELAALPHKPASTQAPQGLGSPAGEDREEHLLAKITL